jgi:ABC-type antimicrobial peptide transport system permease subunit
MRVSRPSDALAALWATDEAFTGLLLGLGAVALLVGGVGVADTMVISVLERRAEIGLRRSLGATRGQIRTQFLAESLLRSALGGVGGALLGIIVTAGYAYAQDWPDRRNPHWVMLGGFAGLPGRAGEPAVADAGAGGVSSCGHKAGVSAQAMAVSRAISTMSPKVCSRSWAVDRAPVLMLSETVRRVSARARNRMAIV